MATKDPFATGDYSANYTGGNDHEEEKLAFYIQLFNQLRARRVNFELQWEETASLCWPEYQSSFFFGRDVAPGMKRQQYQLDTTAQVSSHRFGAIAEWLLTPTNLMWSAVCAGGENGEYLMKRREVALYYEQLTRIMWMERYKPEANFIGQNSQNMQGLGVFGNMGMFTDEYCDTVDPKKRGLSYLATPVGEIYVIRDHQRRVVGFIRHFRLTAQQAKRKWKDKVVPVLEAALQINSTQLYDFLHIVRPRDDYNPGFLLSPKGKKYESVYISYQGHCILEESGYRTMPLAYGAYMQAPDEDYGRGPAQMVLASLKTLNAEKAIFLKQGHRASDPAYLIGDTGLLDLRTNSGSFNAGGVTPDGRPLVHILPTGEIQITEKMMENELVGVNDAFLVNLFKMIMENPTDMNYRQVLEYVNERGIFLAPTIGRQCSEYLGPLHDRELDILSWLRKLPPVPPILKEAKAGLDYQIVYSSPIARSVQSQESAGFMRIVEWASATSQAIGDPSLMDNFDFDTSIAAMGKQSATPPSWFSSNEQKAKARKARADAEERSNQVKELPGKAAIMKAQAISDKAGAGQNTGGALSGTPPTGMPGVPNQQGQITNNQGFQGP